MSADIAASLLLLGDQATPKQNQPLQEDQMQKQGIISENAGTQGEQHHLCLGNINGGGMHNLESCPVSLLDIDQQGIVNENAGAEGQEQYLGLGLLNEGGLQQLQHQELHPETFGDTDQLQPRPPYYRILYPIFLSGTRC